MANGICKSCKKTFEKRKFFKKFCSPECKSKKAKKTTMEELSKEYAPHIPACRALGRTFAPKYVAGKGPSIKDDFYNSRVWLELRYVALKKYGRKCMVCFSTNTEMHVDHIKLLHDPDLSMPRRGDKTLSANSPSRLGTHLCHHHNSTLLPCRGGPF